jgi:acyl-CoA dehydrogenase
VQAPITHLNLPFFDAAHRELATCLSEWLPKQSVDERDEDAGTLAWVALLGKNQWLRYCVAAANGGMLEKLDSRALVIARETLAFTSPLADFAFAMQGLGSGAISIAGTPAQQAAYLPAVARGAKVAAFALTEPQAGSDAGAITTIATKSNDTLSTYKITGEKTWISNGGIASYYCVFAKTEPELGTRGISCFIVDANTPGLEVVERIHTLSPHPLAHLRFNDCVVPASALLGTENAGFKLAMQTLDIFRASVAGAALGMARRALAEAVAYSKARKMFKQTLADFQLTQAKLGEMAALIDGAALLTYRAAWLRDVPGERTTAEAAMAKMSATEAAQQVIDAALQLHGGLGVKVGTKVEALYRDIRALRIYEGATEVQKLIIGKDILKG